MFLILGNAGFISSTVVIPLALNYFEAPLSTPNTRNKATPMKRLFNWGAEELNETVQSIQPYPQGPKDLRIRYLGFG